MGYDEALRRYRHNRFTDDDVTRCTGLSVRGWRELIKVGAVRTITERRGPGRVRLCDHTTFKRTAIIAAIHRAGFSLAMAGRIAYFLPFDELLYAGWDPFTVLFLPGSDVDPQTELPRRRKTPTADWFDPNKPAEADPENDWLLEIYDGRFVTANYKIRGKPDEQVVYADLRNDGATLVVWMPFHDDQRPVFDSRRKEFVDVFRAKWDLPNGFSDRLNHKFLDYSYEPHDAEDDPLRIAAEAAVRNPVFKTSINVTFAVRKALRRYLGLGPTAPLLKYKHGSSP